MESNSSATGSSPAQTQAERLPAVEVSTGPEPRFSVIWLHGLGADGHDFEPVIPMLGLDEGPAVRFVFPHAPVRPVTMNGGAPMRAWYDIATISASRDQDEQGIVRSAEQVADLMAYEVERGVPYERQVLAGFSQGGAMALHVALRFSHSLAGLIALSSYLLFPERLARERHVANARMPVLIGHGTQDPVVPFMMGQGTLAALKALDYPVTGRQYPIEHSVSLEELADIGAWLKSRFAPDAGV